MTRFALVAGGGAVKGYAFHVGVAQAMEQDGYHFRSGLRWNPSEAPPGKREVSLYVGSSAGACVVASLASGHPVAHLRDAIRGRSREVPTFRYRVLFVPVAPNPVRYVGRLMRHQPAASVNRGYWSISCEQSVRWEHGEFVRCSARA